MVENQTVGAKMVESKKSQNCENKSNRSKDETTPILQKNTFCIEWEDSSFVFFEGILRCSRCFGVICGVVSDFFRFI